MAAIDAELESLRGERAPATRSTRAPRRDAHRQATPPGGGLMTRVAVFGTGAGARHTPRCSPMPARGPDVGTTSRAGGPDQPVPRQRRLPPGPPSARADLGDDRPRGGGGRRRRRGAGGPLAAAAGQPDALGRVPAPSCGRRVLDEGRRAGHDHADERGHRRGGRRRSGPYRRRVRAQPGPGDRGQAAGGLGRGVRRRADGRACRVGLCRAVLSALHQQRRRRHRARRRGQERHRPCRRHGRGHGDGGQHQVHDHHPRARRRPCGWGWRWAPTRPPSRVSQGSAT